MRSFSLKYTLILFCLLCYYPIFPQIEKNINTHTVSSSNSEIKIEKAWLLGKINYKKDPRFLLLKKPYTRRTNIYLHRKTYNAFITMHKAAQKENISLEILSGGRNFWHQKKIWEAKWNGQTHVNGKALNLTLPNPLKRAKKILQYSSMPATSRHHWGTDIDINALNNAYFKNKRGKKVYLWLKKNAKYFGFCQVYTQKDKQYRSGYEEERWHWSYLPLAKLLLQEYSKQVSYKNLQGFSGANIASSLDIIQDYVKGIDDRCHKIK